MKTDINNQEKLAHLRHSLAHLLAAAVLEIYPDAKNTIGPAIDNGFYYDFEFSTPIKDSDLKEIQKKMKKLLNTWECFKHLEVTADEARKFFTGNPYKLELIDEISAKNEPITLYYSGPKDFDLSLKNLQTLNYKLQNGFLDLCRGGHLENPKGEIDTDAFKLSRLAGAYWRGDENNKMLTRIYGLAFETKEDLEEYEKMMLEAEKRDHRKLGKELGIFAYDDDVGAGLPLWLPNGGEIIEELEKLAKESEFRDGYKRVKTPHLAKESMYLKSGHLPYYEESMYPPMEYEGGKYYLKAMNCPHHHKIFSAQKHSYRDLPLRFAEYGTVYRHEKSGELFGLMRVRSLQMNDAHIYCSEDQFADEFKKVNEMYLKYFKIFGIDKYVMRFSTHDPKKLGKKYVDENKLWIKTEDMVRKVLIDSKIPYVEIADEAAFYGPKIDVQVWSAIGREFTLATNQVDFAVPKRFNLTYTDKNNDEKTPLCIHRAPLGTHERFIGFLIEHYAGNFPLWLSPVQIKVIPISESEMQYAKKFNELLRENNIRAELDESDNNLGKKIRNAKVEKIPYLAVIGKKEVEENTITLEARSGSLGAMSQENILKKLLEEIKERI